MDTGPLLPLFPLSAVLFPGVTLPLHIFEERYKLMARRCNESDGVLGIVFIRKGEEVGATAEPHDVGTVAKITRIDALSGGKLNLTVAGLTRFRILALNADHSYLRGSISALDDAAPTLTKETVSDIRREYVDYIRTLRRLAQRSEREVLTPDGTIELSYVIAAHLQVPGLVQQRLLEATLDQRLLGEMDILRRENALLRRLGAVTSRHSHSSRDMTPN